MLATLTVAALICAASAVCGEALARLLSIGGWRPWSPAAGLALLIVAALLAVKLPGHGDAGAIALAVLILAAAVIARGRLVRPPGRVLALTVATGIAACIPYISNGRYGIPGISFNNDLTNHIPWASALQNPGVPWEAVPSPGYPLGVHSFAAALSSGTGIELGAAFAATLIACIVVIGWVALAFVTGMSGPRQVLGGLMIAIAYTVSAFYAQANFKELLLTLFLLAMLATAREAARDPGDRPIRRGAQIGVLATGIVVSFSYAGLVWPAAAAAAWAGLAMAVALVVTPGGVGSRVRAAVAPLPKALPYLLGAALAAAVLLLGDLPRLLDAIQIFGSSPAGTGILPSTEVGNLIGQVSKREIFGYWPNEDFRFGIPGTFVNHALGALAILVAGYAAAWSLWRRDLALPAAAGAAVLIAVYLSRTESVYVAAKALAPAGALTMALSVQALLGRPPLPKPSIRFALVAVAVVFAGGALWSSFLVLRGAQIGPRDHERELAELRPPLLGEATLFLGNDELARTMLAGVPIVTRPLGRQRKAASFDGPFDFDSPKSAELDGFRFVVAPRTRYRSRPPSNFELLSTTQSFALWERHGATLPRQVLPEEGTAPGATLDCSTRRGRALAGRKGWASVWPFEPRLAKVPDMQRILPTGARGAIAIDLGRGRWEISLQYRSNHEIQVRFSSGGGGALAANLDRGGPFWRIGDTRRASAGRELLTLDMPDELLDSRSHFAVLSTIAAVRIDQQPELVPLSRACGRYVDWYTLAPERPSSQ